MSILVSPLSKVRELVVARRPKQIVSLLDPGSGFLEFGPHYAGRHLRLRFHDIHDPTDGQTMPSATQIVELLSFLHEWDRDGSILFHCRAGIGRSPAAAFIAACFLNPDNDENEIALKLRAVACLARPNEVLVRLADDQMRRNGRMSRAITVTGRGLPPPNPQEGEPFEFPSAD